MAKINKEIPNVKNTNPDQWMMESTIWLHIAEWVGLLFMFILNFGSKSFRELGTKKKRNIIVGYLLQLVGIFILIYLAYRWQKYP